MMRLTLGVLLRQSHRTSGVSEDLSRVRSEGNVDSTEMLSPSDRERGGSRGQRQHRRYKGVKGKKQR